MRKRLVILVMLVGLAIGGVVLWRFGGPLEEALRPVVTLPPGAPTAPPGPPVEELPIAVRTFKTAEVTFTDTLPLTGTIRGQQEVPLKFEVSGVVRTINFREGDLVEAGEIVAILDDRDAQLKVEHAQKRLEAAEAQANLAATRLSVHERLFGIGAIIQAKLDEARAEFAQAKAQVETALKEVDLAQAEWTKTSLKAPIGGVIGTVDVEPGELVMSNPSPTTIALLADVRNVMVELGIIERDIEKVKLGQKAKVTVDAFPNAEFEGAIEFLTPVIEGKSRTLTAKVKVSNEGGALLPGMFARAELTVFEKEDALIVPTTGLQDLDGDGTFESVFIVELDQTARVRPIRLGYVTTDYAEILEGLAEDEQVVVEARGKLKDGARVSLLEVEESGLRREEPRAEEEEGIR